MKHALAKISEAKYPIGNTNAPVRMHVSLTVSDINECAALPCGAVGHCLNTPGSFACSCPQSEEWDVANSECVCE